MSPEEMLAMYDQDERINERFAGVQREETPEVIRHVPESGSGGWILYTRLTTENADRAIREQMEYFGKRGIDFEWKLFDHDTPPDLRQRLATHGFEIGEEEALMALDLAAVPAALLSPVTHDVRRLVDPAQVADVQAVEEQVWGDDQSHLAGQLAAEMRDEPEHVSVYVAYMDHKPASAAWIRFHEHSRFASLWGGSTMVEYRNRGLYTALLAVRVQEAIRRGARVLSIDASPMSRPIVARFGFQFLTCTYPCTLPQNTR